MAQLVDVLAMLCRKGFGDVKLTIVEPDGPEGFPEVTVREEYEREETRAGSDGTQGNWGSAMPQGKLTIFRYVPTSELTSGAAGQILVYREE